MVCLERDILVEADGGYGDVGGGDEGNVLMT